MSNMKISVNQPDIKLGIKINASGGGGGALPYYEGAYNVRPKVFEQTLHTANKSMARDVKIEKIPLDEISNPYGKTIIIGL